MEKDILKFDNVSKKYSEDKGIFEINYVFNENEIYILIGNNGSGKTTLLETVALRTNINEGVITLNEIDINKVNKSLISYLPESFSLYSDYKTIDMIMLSYKLTGGNSKSIEKDIDKLLNEFEILQYKNNKISTLSKGNKQLVQIICCLINNPKVLLLDEPFSGLDVDKKILVANKFLSLRSEAIIIMTLHERDAVELIDGKNLIIEKGRLKEAKDDDLSSYFKI